jgi:hypothetical protein
MGKIKYSDIINSSSLNEAQRLDADLRIDSFLSKVAGDCPDLVCKLMEDQYEAINGKHINKWLAKQLVADMWHTSEDGKTVSGEIITVDQAQSLLSNMNEDMKAKFKWDAYVGANAFAHDLSDIGLSQEQIIKAARKFWFHDEDMPEGNKVYWYFKDRVFEV